LQSPDFAALETVLKARRIPFFLAGRGMTAGRPQGEENNLSLKNQVYRLKQLAGISELKCSIHPSVGQRL
jgi:hypothetical protein